MIMRMLAPSVLAAAALAGGFAIAGCITAVTAKDPAPMQPVAADASDPPGRPQHAIRIASTSAAGLPLGDYACDIASGEYHYPSFRCVLARTEDGGLFLEKLGGSQRFRGRVFEAKSGFAFEGTFFCPWGDCTSTVEADFQPQGDGSFRGVLVQPGQTPPPHKGASLLVTLRHMPGGFTYGGASYGGAGYGGATYGGARYARPSFRPR